MEAEPADTPLLRPGPGNGEGGGGGGQVGEEGGVETGHQRKGGPEPAERPQGVEGRRVVERGEIAHRRQRLDGGPVDDHRAAEVGAAVHEADAGAVERGVAQEPGQFLQFGLALPAGQVVGGHHRRVAAVVVVVEDPQLQAARAGVDDQRPHVSPATSSR